jgi:hypothetical protein
MEYAEAINAQAAERAFAIAARRLATSETANLRELASNAVSLAYCVCVVDGEDAAERGLSAIHERLIEELEQRLADWIGLKHEEAT